MIKRLIPILFLTLFFAALPAWFLSTLEGWIFVDCFRNKPEDILECKILERFAFSSRSAAYTTVNARSLKNYRQDRRGRSVTYQLMLLTPGGEVQVLRSSIGNADVDRIATNLNTAIGSNTMEFHAEMAPDPLFWMAFVLLIVFAGAGILIALVATASESTETERRPV
ncbi:hypothetical protein AB3N59_13630 [Leptospira sp. WS92.C1]